MHGLPVGLRQLGQDVGIRHGAVFAMVGVLNGEGQLLVLQLLQLLVAEVEADRIVGVTNNVLRPGRLTVRRGLYGANICAAEGGDVAARARGG